MRQVEDRTADSAAITPYAMVGGEPGVRRLVGRFYEIMDKDSAAAQIRAMHAADLAPVRERLFEFLSSWLGGPPIYHQSPQRKCIVSVHSEFAIDERARDQWLACMRQAMVDVGLPEQVRDYLDGPLARLAEGFRNR